MRSNPVFVTGTDTEVGKTLVSSALLRLARGRGFSCVGLKPIAAGCELHSGEWRNEDALELMAAAATELDYEAINPVALEPPIAPHIALVQAGRAVTAAELARHCNTVGTSAEFVLVEGAGGWLVPLNDEETLADVCRLLHADVVLVIGMKLGCINHALLTVNAIAAAGLHLAGWVANCVTGTMPFLEENLKTLRSRIDAPCLGTIPKLEVGSATAAMAHLTVEPLLL